MTHTEFAAWLDGFLDGKLSPEDVERVRMKAQEVAQEVPFVPSYPFPQSPDWRRETGYAPWVFLPVVTRSDTSPLGGEFSAVWDANADTLYQS